MNRTLLHLLILAITTAGCITPDAPQQAEPDQPTPDQPDHIDLNLTPPDATPTATPDHLVDANNTSEDRSAWRTCDPRHNESWRYQHGCGMYASSGGGGRSAPQAPSAPIPEPATILSVVLGLVGIVINYRIASQH